MDVWRSAKQMGPFAVSVVGLASFFALVLGATKGINDPWEWWAIVAISVALAAFWQFHRLRCARDTARLKPMVEQHRDEALSLIAGYRLIAQGDDVAYMAWQGEAGYLLGEIRKPFAKTISRNLGPRYAKPFGNLEGEVPIAASKLRGGYRFDSGFPLDIERAAELLNDLMLEMVVPRSIFRPMDTPFTSTRMWRRDKTEAQHGA